MSYNINSIRIIKSNAFAINKAKLDALRENDNLNRPEVSFLDEEWEERNTENVRGLLFIDNLWWEGEGSGRSYDTLKMLLVRFSGDADIIITWEDGETSGLRLRDGHVTEPEVVQSLADE